MFYFDDCVLNLINKICQKSRVRLSAFINDEKHLSMLILDAVLSLFRQFVWFQAKGVAFQKLPDGCF